LTAGAAELLLEPLVHQVAQAHLGAVSAGALTEAALSRAEQLKRHLNCFITIDAEGALDRARALDALPANERKRLPLFGAPVAHKDMFARRGRRTTFGSKLYVDHRPNANATVIDRLEAAGAVDIGALNMSEFACNPFGMNILVGPARNPWQVGHIAGGSSSGSAAAVASGLVAGSLGSDTGGSVRLPAALCGVFGLVPTNGRVSRNGMLALSHSLDNAGPLARSVRDVARLLSAIAGYDRADTSSSNAPVDDYERELDDGIEGLRVGFAANHYAEEMDADTKRMMARTEEVFADCKAACVTLEVPDPRPLDVLGNVLILSEAASYHRDDLQARGDLYTPLVRERIAFGLSFDASTYVDALRLRPVELARFLSMVFDEVDVLVLPTVPHGAPSFTDVEAALAGKADLSFPLAKFTRSINYLGLPAITVPHGHDGRGLPLAFQIVGRPFREALVLRVARAFECAVPPRFPSTAKADLLPS
jgi:aspartyl-tRNA(Asn)/glutamyl-tRNA(Gln) amidotransferase subunit A